MFHLKTDVQDTFLFITKGNCIFLKYFVLPTKKRNGLSEISAAIDPSLISLRRNCETKRMKVTYTLAFVSGSCSYYFINTFARVIM